MSRGNSDNSQSSISLVDRLNRMLARLMGKKSQPTPAQPPEVPSNYKFAAIVALMVLVLWLLTGVYYIPADNYGIILKNGHIAAVERGIKVSWTYPYPLANIVIMDAAMSSLTIGKGNELGLSEFKVATSDNRNLGLSIGVNYYISDPKTYFLNYYQEDSDLNQRVSWLIKAIVQDYSLQHSSKDLLQGSMIVVSNELRDLSTKLLANYGISIHKLTINSVYNLDSVQESQVSSAKPLAASSPILQQAHQYQSELNAKTKQYVTEFNQLLPQYQANHEAIVELMYYKLLSELPRAKVAESFPLLKMSESQYNAYLSEQSTSDFTAANSNGDLRHVDRSVNRVRSFKDR